MTLDELKAKYAAMTPGPYTAIGTSVVDWNHEAKTFTMEFIPNRFNEKQTEDARGLVALHNAFSALVERYERALEALGASHKIVCHAIMCDMPITKAVADARNKAVAVLATAAKPLTEDA